MKFTHLAVAFALASSSMAINAQQVEVTVTNLTQAIHYTPFLISAHSADMSLYQLGQAASAELQMMAEGGDISGLSAILTNASADIIENPAAGLLAPAMSTTAMLDTSDGNTHLSLVSMLLPTNDGFVGLNAWEIPTEAGTYSFTLNAYDAGTEANDEIITGGGAPGAAGIPLAPGGDAARVVQGLLHKNQTLWFIYIAEV